MPKETHERDEAAEVVDEPTVTEDVADTGPTGGDADGGDDRDAAAAGAQEAGAGADVEALAAEVAALTAQRDEYLDALRRVQAEFDNYRKRIMREGAAQRESGSASVVTALLDVIDEFELAVLASGSATDVEGLRRGVELVYGKLVDVLRSFGVSKIDDEGVAFDPETHDAVAYQEGGEGGEPVVVEVLRPGYRFRDRVLRPAMVKVSK